MSSMVMSVDHPGLTFNLTLMRSEPTYNQPVQQWTFTSDFAVSMTGWTLFVSWCTTWNIRCVNLCDEAAGKTDTDWCLSICPLCIGERLLRDLHSEADPLYNSPEYGIHSSTCLQSQGTNHLRSRHQVPASKAIFLWTVRSKSGMFLC